jgi:multidrug efflux pump subunit AcrB
MYIKFGIKGDSHKGKKAAFLQWIQNFYDVVVEKSFKRKKLIVIIDAGSFLVGLAILAISPQQSFPQIERNQFAVEVFFTGRQFASANRCSHERP